MSDQQETHFVKQWTSGIMHLAQQKFSRMREAVMMVPHTVGEETFLDYIGLVTPKAVTTRHGDTPITSTPQSRRKITMTPYKHADLVDKTDLIRTLNDPTNPFMVSFGRGFGRVLDDIGIAAAFATAATGKDGTGTAAFDTTNYRITAGGTGMTLAKIIGANKRLRAAENDPDEGFFMMVSQEQIEDMLLDTTFTSNDYNSIRALMTGQISQFMGFTWIASERLGTTSGERRCIAWAKNSIGLLIGQEPMGRISERDDKNYSTQVFMSMDAGGARTNETGVVEILCVE